MGRALRITVLLLVLLVVGGQAWLDRFSTTHWQRTVLVGAFPVSADGSAASNQYLAQLDQAKIDGISSFLKEEARRYGVGIDEPIELTLYPTLTSPPPLQRGLTAVVHLFASRSQEAQNRIVITHELLHTFGATDKYDLASGLPIYPDGFVEPQLEPHYPQQLAEIMAGRLPITATEAQLPESLAQERVGPLTAREIGWVRH